MSAWATANGVTLGQVVPDGAEQVGAIPDLLRTVDLSGATVTTDAAGCQVGNKAVIRERGGHDLLAVKGNQSGLSGAVRTAFDRACGADFAGVRCDRHEAVEAGQGRRKERYTTVLYGPAGLPGAWRGAAAAVCVGRERETGGAAASGTHDYVTSHPGTAAEIAGLVRGHLGVESMLGT